MRFSMRMMWGCVAVTGVVVVLALAGAAGVSGGYALPCLLMMGAMMCDDDARDGRRLASRRIGSRCQDASAGEPARGA
jgi:hypothetical protein